MAGDATACELLVTPRSVPISQDPVALAEVIQVAFVGSLGGEPAEIVIYPEPGSEGQLREIMDELSEIEGVTDVEFFEVDPTITGLIETSIDGTFGPYTAESIPPSVRMRVSGDEALERVHARFDDDPAVLVVGDDRSSPLVMSEGLRIVVPHFDADLDRLTTTGPDEVRTSAAEILRIHELYPSASEADIESAREAAASLVAYAVDPCGFVADGQVD